MSKINKVTSFLSLGIITVTPIATVISCKKPVAPKSDSGSDQTGKDKAEKDQTGKDKAEKDKAEKDKAEKDKAEKDKAEKDKAEKDKAEKDKTEAAIVKQSDLKTEIEKQVNADFIKAAAKRKDDISKVNLAMVKGVLNGHLDKKFKILVSGIKAVVLTAYKELTITLGDNTKVVIYGVEITKKVVEDKTKTTQQLINEIASFKKKYGNKIKTLIVGKKKTSEITVELIKQFFKNEFRDKTFSNAINSISAIEMKPESSSEVFTLIIRFKDSNKIVSISNVYLEKIITQKEVNHYGEYTSTMKGFLKKYAKLITNTTPKKTKVFAHENNGHYSLGFASTQTEYIASGLALAKKFGFEEEILGATTDKLNQSFIDAKVPLKKNKLVVGFYNSQAKIYSYYDYQRNVDGTLNKDSTGKTTREEFDSLQSALDNYERVVKYEVNELTIFNYIKGSWSDLKQGLSEAGVDITTGEFKTQADAIDKFLVDNEPKIVVDDKTKDKAFLKQFKGEITVVKNPIISRTSKKYKATLHTGKTSRDPYYVLYGLEYAKHEYKGSSRELFVNKGIKKIYVLKAGEDKNSKKYAFIWLELKDGKIVLAQRFFKQKFPDIKFTRNFGFPDIDPKYADLGAYVKNIVNGTETSTDGGNETKVKTVADLKAAIAVKEQKIQKALTGKTIKIKIKKIKDVLKSNLDDAYDTLIDGLKLYFVMDGSAVVISGAIEITIKTSTTSSTTTPVTKTVEDLQAAIKTQANAIKEALTGKTKEMEINKVRAVLKDNLDVSYKTLIDGLNWKSAKDGKVYVTSGSIEIIIKTSTTSSTTTSTVKTIADLQAAIKAKTEPIKNALTGKTSKIKIKKIKDVLKSNLDDAYNTLIDGLKLDNAMDGKTWVISGDTEIEIATSTWSGPTQKVLDLKRAISWKRVTIKKGLNGKIRQMNIEKVKKVLWGALDNSYHDLINNLTLVVNKDWLIIDHKNYKKIILKSGSTKFMVETSTTNGPTIMQFKATLRRLIVKKRNVFSSESIFRSMMKNSFISNLNSTKKIKQIIYKILIDDYKGKVDKIKEYKKMFDKIKSIKLKRSSKTGLVTVAIKYMDGTEENIYRVQLRKIRKDDIGKLDGYTIYGIKVQGKEVKKHDVHGYKKIIMELFDGYSKLVGKKNAQSMGVYSCKINGVYSLFYGKTRFGYLKIIKKIMADYNWWDPYFYNFKKSDIGKTILEVGNIRKVTVSNKIRMGYYDLFKDKYAIFAKDRDSKGNISKDDDGNGIDITLEVPYIKPNDYKNAIWFDLDSITLPKFIKNIWPGLKKSLQETGVDLTTPHNKVKVKAIEKFINNN